MHSGYQLAGGSVTGAQHIRLNRNNQDELAWWTDGSYVLGVVADGCSAGARSEVGSRIGARAVMKHIRSRLHLSGPGREVCPRVRLRSLLRQADRALLSDLELAADLLGGDRRQTVIDYLLFTLVGFVVTPQITCVFSVGDGVYGLNGAKTRLEPWRENEPAYPAYRLPGFGDIGIDRRDACLQVRACVPTGEFSSLFVGTDGVSDLMEAEHSCEPGSQRPVGPLSQFWQEDRFFANQFALPRKLANINRNVVKRTRTRSGWTLVRQNGLLPDDTTLLVCRQAPVPGGEIYGGFDQG